MQSNMNIQALKQSYPGFPEFVYHVMEEVRRGKTPEEAAAAVGADEIREAIANSIVALERHRAAFGRDGRVELPGPVDMDLD